MSNYIEPTPHPDTGKVEDAEWLDNYFGRHRYGVRFADGKIYRAGEVIKVEMRLDKEMAEGK